MSKEIRHRQYRQTLILGLIQVVKELFPEEQLKIDYSILDGVHCELEKSPLSSREVAQIQSKLNEWVRTEPMITYTLEDDNYFHCNVNELHIKTLYPPLKNFGEFPYTIIYYPPGFILQFVTSSDKLPLSVRSPEKLSTTFLESQRWVENLNLDKVKDVNEIIDSGRTQELISLAEALHEKKVSMIADLIFAQRKNIRIVLISGPSSSGKTTFAKRLSTQLSVNGLKPVALHLDNYFVSREETPKDTSGEYDFESLYALDLSLLNEHVRDLIHGKEIECPIYDFVEGKRKAEGEKIRIDSDEILIIEGIHGLNPRLLPTLERNQLYKIYVSALFQLNLDFYNRISTTEVRLIRRLVRDDKYRGINPQQTLNQWSSVRRGENTNIFPYQEEADVMFNSSLLYELNALRPFAESLLATIPEDHPDFDTSTHLLRLVSHFSPIEISKVPFNSILREFIGGGIY